MERSVCTHPTQNTFRFIRRREDGSVTNLEVLAGGLDWALVRTLVLHRVLAAGAFFQV